MFNQILDSWDNCRLWVQRRRWWIRLAAAVVLAPWFAHFAYTRMTVMPPGLTTADNENYLPPLNPKKLNLDEIARSTNIDDIIYSMPPAPHGLTQATAPAGYRWVLWQYKDDPAAFDRAAAEYAARPTTFIDDDDKFEIPEPQVKFSSAMVGPWDPKHRLFQGETLRYVLSPKVTTILNRLCDLTKNTPHPDYDYSDSQVWDGLRLRSRYHFIQKRDQQAGAEDIRTAMVLALAIYKPNRRIQDLAEIRYLSREVDFKPEIGRYLLDFLADVEPPDAKHLLKSETEYVMDGLHEQLDNRYTRLKDGQGWPIFTHYYDGGIPPWHIRVLNLTSPLFHDRQDVQNWVNGIETKSLKLIPLNDAQLRKTIQNQKQLAPILRTYFRDVYIFDTPTRLMTELNFSPEQVLFTGLSHQAEHQAIRICIALSVHHHDHQQYPQSLDELAPAYLNEIPQDPLSGRSFKYSCTEDGQGYTLNPADISLYDIREHYQNLYVYGPDRPAPGKDSQQEWVLARKTD